VRHNILTAIAASAAISATLLQARAADLETAPPSPPAVEAPPPAVAAPPAVIVAPAPPCPVVWRCGPWGCGWRSVCAPLVGAYWGPPAVRFYGSYGYYRPWGGYRPYVGQHHGWRRY
jgi:hypothetical protein